jgi:hypothetical protein
LDAEEVWERINIKCVFLSAMHILFETVDNVKVSGDDFKFINHQQLETVTFNRSVTVIEFEEENC